jgi:heme/copper-type cytochrome/quinol oxidase subunit 2
MVFTIFWSCALIAVVVFGVMVYSIARYRIGPTNSHTFMEVLWALVPIAIFVGAALPAARKIAGDSGVAVAAEQRQAASSVH